jgi:parallel beta-helix repeat protein
MVKHKRMYLQSNTRGKVNTAGKWLSLLAITGACQFVSAATWCVSPGGSCGNASIGAAIKTASPGDTIQVQPGIYNESVYINMPLTLAGAGGGSTIINAIGQSTGIFIDGSAKAPATGISHVIVSGVSVQNANFEGILVVNASEVTISNSQVVNNDRSLNATAGTCPNQPPFETDEGFDCGEGIHLMAVSHSIVANNIVKNNAGGILISDETGASHDNLIAGNTVSNNAYDCGITLASHTPAPSSGLKLPAGVYHNIISGNISTNNGLLAPGAGAGVGIFAPGPGNQNYGNVVINNTLTGNGLPGVTMHNHASVANAPPVNMNDNMIIGNVISGNAADTDDAATPGTTGINIFSLAPVTGTIIAQNKISNEQIDIAINTPPADVLTRLNDLQGQAGVNNLGAGTVDAAQNYWGCASGPGLSGCGGVVGLVLSANWAIVPF